MKPIRILLTVSIAFALAACHRGGKENDQRTASGQVLQGSISDGMIPYEALKSKPPLAPRSAAKAVGAAASATEAASGGEAPAEAPQAAEPAPAVSPSSAVRY